MTQHTMTEASSSDECTRIDPHDDYLVMFKFITDKRTVAFELELFQSKWFDYRHLTAVQATRLYIQAYENISRAKYAANFDKRTADYIRTISVDWIFNGLDNADAANHKKAKSHFTACWHGRQLADTMGIPYDIYIDLAFEIRLRYWNRHYLPQPQHLYNSANKEQWIAERVEKRWEELKASRLFTSDHPAYLVQNYDDIPHQNAYHEYLFEIAKKRSNPSEMIGRFVNEDLLPLRKAQTRAASEPAFANFQRYLH